MTEQKDPQPGRSRRGAIAVVLGMVVVLIMVVVWLTVRGADAPIDDDRSSPAAVTPSDSPGTAGDGAAPPSPNGQPTAATPTASPGADAETPVPGGTTPIEKPPTTEEVPFDAEVTVDSSLAVEIVSVEAITAGRDIPGEVSGPAVKVVVRVENGGAEAVDTSGVSVNLTYGGDDRTPAVELIDDASAVLPAMLKPGDAAEASHVFAVPLASAGNVRIMVDVLATESDVVFVGPRPQ